MHPAVALGIAYLAGSIPTAYLAGRLLKGVDLRTIGSGNLGATNVYRSLGTPAALAVLTTDAAKGALPVLLLPSRIDGRFVSGSDALLWWGLACGVVAILGHARPVFLFWRGGGKGVATAAGVFGSLAPAALGAAFVLFVLIVWRTRFISLASISAALVLPLVIALAVGPSSPLFSVSCAVAAFVVWAHRSNIGRLRQGTETRFGSKDSTEDR